MAGVAPPVRRRRIGVFLPVAACGEQLDTAINQAVMLKAGAETAGEGVEVVFSHVRGNSDSSTDFRRLAENGISLRETTWQQISKEELRLVGKYLGVEYGLDAPAYVYPSDGAGNFLDCDFWYVIADPTMVTLAPIRPYVVFVTDCRQRHVPESLGEHDDAGFLATTRHAALVLCLTPLAHDDLIQYVGLPERKIALISLPPDPLSSPLLWNRVRQHVR